MPRQCSVCVHGQHETIDEALVAGESLRDISKRFGGVTDSGLSRHRKSHLSPALQKLSANRESNRQGTLLDRLQGLSEKAYQVLDTAETTGKHGMMLAAIREVKGMLELEARMTGELDERSQTLVVNLTSTSEWIDLQSIIRTALRPYPEAWRAVAAAIGGGSGGQSVGQITR